MAQDNEYVQKLIAAQDREVAHRRDIAEVLTEKYNRGDTENMRRAAGGRRQVAGGMPLLAKNPARVSLAHFISDASAR